jgi:hypothetical protein
MIKNIKEKLIYFILAILCCTGVTFLSCPGILRALDSNCEAAKANVWYKISTDSATYGEVIRLDMSRGQSYSDGRFIVIVAQDLDTKEIIYIAFPDGGDWTIFSREDSLYMEMEKDINDLQEYLDRKGSTEIKKK